MFRFIALFALATPLWAQTTSLVAKYNMQGVTGTVTFTQQAVGSDVTITLDLNGVTSGSYQLDLHEFRVNFDVADRCDIASLGNVKWSHEDMIGTAEVTSGRGSFTASGMDLSGTKSIEGRSFVLRGGALKACATIEAEGEYITAFAALPAALGGVVIFRQQEASADADTVIDVSLYFVGSMTDRPTADFDWQINSGTVKMDTVATTDVADRCGNTGSLFNPTASSNTGCSTSNHADCAVGLLSAKHGGVSVATSGTTRKFYGDLSLPLSGPNSIIGKTIVFMDSATNVFACANIVEYPRMTATARFSNDGMSGTVTLSQKSPLDVASIDVELVNPMTKGQGYKIAQYPVPQQMVKSDDVCDMNHIGDTFNPFSVTSSPGDGTTTPDRHAVGDLSGKFNKLSTPSVNITMADPNLQLFGRNSVVGRSLVVYSADVRRWVCATLRSTRPTTTAVVKFTFPVIGYVIMQQPRDMWYADTQIYVELDYGTGASATTAHNWHIHVNQTGSDTLADQNRCKSVAGHYNPYAVDLGSSYGPECSANTPYRCEVGDLSKKHGQIGVRTQGGAKTRYMFTDAQLPLHGPQSVIGRSITIHGGGQASVRLSCANVLEQKERKLRVNKWSSAADGGNPTGSITFDQLCTDIWACESRLKVQLSNLGDVKGYHVHKYPTTTDMTADKTCQAADVSGHFNPLDGPAKGPDTGTNDMYEVGDLSGKFGSLSPGTVDMSMGDMNLPLEGPLSVARRSVVIHLREGAKRWACGNIEDTQGALVQAKATFTGDYVGYILLSQYEYPDGSKSPTSILVDVRNKDGVVTSGHNWHVHQHRKYDKDSTCQSCKGHYNPFMVDMGAGYSECGLGNPLRCEVGDQSKKFGERGPYDIGTGKAFHTDVNLDVEGTFSASKRSIVIHAANGGAPRLTCANIIPHGDSSRSYNDYGFLTDSYTSGELEEAVARALETDVSHVLAVPAGSDSTCSRADIYFLGSQKSALKATFTDLVQSGNHKALGRFKPDSQCTTSAAGLAQVSLHLLAVSFLLALLWQRR